MRFNVAIVDSQFAHFLHDAARYLLAGFEELGHSCTLSRNALEPGRVNVIVNGHTIRSPRARDELVNGHRYVVLQSELVQEGKSNLSPPVLEHVYLPLLRGAVHVWDLLPENAAHLSTLGIKASPLRFGYAAALEEIRMKKERDIDFLFFGSLTPHRLSVLRTLERMGYSVRAVFDHVALYRNDLIARSKIVLSIRQSPEVGHLPWLRIVYAVNNRALVVAEQCDDQAWLQDCFRFARPDRFIELCERMRGQPQSQRDASAELLHAHFRSMPMAEMLDPLLANLPPAK